MLTREQHENLRAILKEELIPAMGCTEPIAIALAGAIARKHLGETFTRIRVACSSNIIKNVKSVIIPSTQALHGIEAAAVAGAVAGNADAGMQVLSGVSEEEKKEISRIHSLGLCQSEHLPSPHVLHILVEMEGASHRVKAEIFDAHDNLVYLEKDGEVLLDRREGQAAEAAETKADRSILNLNVIKEYADTADLESLRPILLPQIENNMAIAEEGLSGKYGLHYASMLLYDDPNVYEKMEAYAAAGSEARMSGCSMPVTINSGSGNQGIAASVPAVIYCREKGCSEEKMLRMLIFSNLITIYQKQYIGKLSAFCGAVSATCASGAALSYVEGGSLKQIGNTIANTLAVTAGIICDGAKSSCGAKIAISLHAAIIAHRLAMQGKSYWAGDGIVCQDADTTIKGVGRIAKYGMSGTDREIIAVMLGDLEESY